MADYRFETTWRLPASQADAWALLFDGEGWPRWWPSVRRVERLAPGAPDGSGRRLRYHFGTRLPYTLTFDAEVVDVAEPSRLVAAADGELVGTWTCELATDGADVVVRHIWAVTTNRRWMNVLAPLARPVFAWNHAALMREGARGFAAELGTVARVDGGRRGDTARRGSSVLAATGAAVALWLIVRAVRRRG